MSIDIMRAAFRMLVPSLVALLTFGHASAQLDLSATIDVHCGDAPIVQTTGQPNAIGGSVAVGSLCSGSQPTNGQAYSYGIVLATPQLVTISATGAPLQLTLLALPWGADDCALTTPLGTDPSLSVCLGAGYHVVLVSTPSTTPVTYTFGVQCESCDPVPLEAAPWGGWKARFR